MDSIQSYNRPFNIPFLRDDFDGGLVFGRGGGLFSPGFGFVINPPLVDEADRGKEDVAELVVELVSLFASPLVGLNKGIQNVNSSNIIYLFSIKLNRRQNNIIDGLCT